MVERRLRTHWLRGKALRFWRRIGVESSVFHLSAARPESSADNFMGIGLTRNTVCALAFRSTPSGETRQSKIKTSPEEMHWTGLPDKARPEFLQNLIRRKQDAPEAVRIFRIVGSVDTIFIKRNRVGNLHRHLPDFHLDSRGAQRVNEFAIKTGYGLGTQWKLSGHAITHPDTELVVNEVEFDFEYFSIIRNGRGSQPAGTHVERHVPPVVYQRSERQPDFTHNLCPHVKRGPCVLPGSKRESRPAVRGI